MKNYVKVVQAVQYLGDIKVLKDILNKKDVIEVENGIYIFKESGFPEAGYWRLKETDFIIKEGNTISVYKEARFLSQYDEVLVKDVVVEKDIKEIKVKEFIEVKTEKKIASEVVDKNKKE